MEDAITSLEEEETVAIAKPRKLSINDLETLRVVATRYDAEKDWQKAVAAWKMVITVRKAKIMAS
jgi:cytochrome c-type biogenesis protein CcmH/NrfG